MSLRCETRPVGPVPRLRVSSLAHSRSFAVDSDLKPAFLARGEAAVASESLFREGALCVTTGQQPGLLTGALYVFHKALTAVALSRRLASVLGRPVVPVFWVAGDDHDFLESNHCHILTVENQVARLQLRDRSSEQPQLPMYQERLGSEMTVVMEALTAGTPPTEFKDRVIDLIESHYRPDNDLASAFADTIADLFGPLGLVVFQPYHPAAKRAAGALTLRAICDARRVDDLLLQHARDLEARGATVPIKVGSGASTVMIEAAQGRDRLVVKDGAFRSRRSGERWSVDDLESIVEKEPSRLSANVLLRPVLEAALLPTLSYVAGPGELAYLAQAEPLYDYLGVAPQAKIARWGGSILEAKVVKILDKFGVTSTELAAPEGQLEARLVQDDMPQDVSLAIGELRSVFDRQFERLGAAAKSLDPTLEKPVRAEEANLMRRLAELEKRFVSHLKKRNSTVISQLAKARANLYPLGRPQERVLNALPYLIRYGDLLVERVMDECVMWVEDLESTPHDK